MRGKRTFLIAEPYLNLSNVVSTNSNTEKNGEAPTKEAEQLPIQQAMKDIEMAIAANAARMGSAERNTSNVDSRDSLREPMLPMCQEKEKNILAKSLYVFKSVQPLHWAGP